MDSRGLRFRELSERLAAMGVAMKPPAVNRRINRGNFTAGFFLMCLEAMEARFEVSAEQQMPGQGLAKESLGDPLSPFEEIFARSRADKPSN